MSEKMQKRIKAIRLSSSDNVATLLADVRKGGWVDVVNEKNQIVAELKSLQAIPFGNKMALHSIAKGQVIKKASYPIGVSISLIGEGDLVHVQNVRSVRVDIPEPIIEKIIQQMNIEC